MQTAQTSVCTVNTRVCSRCFQVNYTSIVIPFFRGHPCIRLDFSTSVGEFVVWAYGLRFPSLFHPFFLHVFFSSHRCKSANTLKHWTVVCTFVSGVHTLVNMVARLIIVKQCMTDMTREYNYATLNSCVYFSSSAHGGTTLLFANPLQIKDYHCVGLSFIIVLIFLLQCRSVPFVYTMCVLTGVSYS